MYMYINNHAVLFFSCMPCVFDFISLALILYHYYYCSPKQFKIAYGYRIERVSLLLINNNVYE